MNPLNEDELNSLLQQARAKPPRPSHELTARTLRAYRQRLGRRPWWRGLASVPLGWRVGALAAVLFVLMATFSPSSSDVGQDGPLMPQRAVPQASDLTLNNLQPVAQIEPRVVRSMKDDQ
jgi:hypothetical protein